MPRMSRFVFALVCLSLVAFASPQSAGAYTVQAGDTPLSIAKAHGISVDALLKANKSLKPNKMRLGDTLTIPGGATEKNEKKHSEKTSGKEKAGSKSDSVSAKERAAEARDREKEHKAPATKTSAGYTVKKGDTLGGIAAKHDVSTDDILKLNKGLTPARLKVGQEIVLPGGAPAAAKTEKAEKPSRKTEKAEKAETARESQESSAATYTARKHDTPGSVARKFHTTTRELARLNPEMGKKLHSGQKLLVPAEASSRKVAEPVERPVPAPLAEPEAVPERPAKAARPREPEAVPERPAKVARTPEPAEAAPAQPESRDTSEAETAFEKGVELGKQNKFPKAVESFDKAIKLTPNRADFYASRGHAHYYMKDYSKAIADYTKAIEKNPNYALSYSMRGLSRTRSGQYPQAIEDFNRAIGFGPNEADYYKGRGFTYLLMEQYGPMCQDYQKACSLGDCELLDSAKKEKKCQ